MEKRLFTQNKHLFALFLVSAVIVSGCTQNTGAGPGVVITEFEPDFAASVVESGDAVQLRFRVQNQGGADATNVVARLFGIDPQDWGLGVTTDIPLGNLRSAVVTGETEGEESPSEFYQLIAPILPEGIRNTYNPQLRVYYGYQTNAKKSVTIVAEDELRRLEIDGLSIPSQPTEVSVGPLIVNVRLREIQRARSTFGLRSFPLEIEIINSGGGFVSSINPSTQDGQILLQADLPIGLAFATDDPTCASLQGGAYVFLFANRDTTVVCDVEIISPPLVSEQREIIITLTYEYYIDSQPLNIPVVGTVRGGGLF